MFVCYKNCRLYATSLLCFQCVTIIVIYVKCHFYSVCLYKPSVPLLSYANCLGLLNSRMPSTNRNCN